MDADLGSSVLYINRVDINLDDKNVPVPDIRILSQEIYTKWDHNSHVLETNYQFSDVEVF